MYRIWLPLSATTIAAVLALAGCEGPAAGIKPAPHPNPPPRPPASATPYAADGR